MGNIWESLSVGIISGLISGLLSSLIMQIITRINKPRIKISDQIACKKNDSGENEYRFKIVNLSRSYAKNMLVLAELVNVTNDGSGTVSKVSPLTLARDDIRIIKPYSNNNDNKDYAIRFRLLENLEKVWVDAEHTHVQITVYCEKERSGVGKVFEKKYYRRDIIQGSFITGKSTEISEQTRT